MSDIATSAPAQLPPTGRELHRLQGRECQGPSLGRLGCANPATTLLTVLDECGVERARTVCGVHALRVGYEGVDFKVTNTRQLFRTWAEASATQRAILADVLHGPAARLLPSRLWTHIDDAVGEGALHPVSRERAYQLIVEAAQYPVLGE